MSISTTLLCAPLLDSKHAHAPHLSNFLLHKHNILIRHCRRPSTCDLIVFSYAVAQKGEISPAACPHHRARIERIRSSAIRSRLFSTSSSLIFEPHLQGSPPGCDEYWFCETCSRPSRTNSRYCWVVRITSITRIWGKRRQDEEL